MANSSRSRSSSRRIFLPSIVLAVLACLWSVFWWYASTRVQVEWDKFVQLQADRGVLIQCGQQAIAGYPFRLEFHCGDVSVKTARTDRIINITLPGLNAVAQVYQPNKVVLQAKGPLKVVDSASQGATLTASWSNAQASMSIWTSGLENSDVVLKGLSVAVSRADTSRSVIDNAAFELHIRRAQGDKAGAGAYDIATKLDAQALPVLDARLGSALPLSAEFQATVTQLDMQPGSSRERMKQWAEAGGSLDIVLAQVTRGQASARVSGTLGVDVKGHPTGDLSVAIAGIDAITTMVENSGLASNNVVEMISLGLPMLGQPSSIKGAAAVEFPVKLREGNASIGSFPVGPLPSLF